MTDGFVFYRSFYEAMEDLDAETFKACTMALCRYALSGEVEEWAGAVKMLMALAKPQIDANLRRRENGNKGGRPRKQNLGETKINLDETKQNLGETKAEPKEKVKVKVKDKEKEKVKEKDISRVLDAWEGLPDSIPKPRTMTDARRHKIEARIAEYGEDTVIQAIKDAKESSFLMGESSSWHITIDWFFEPRNMAKVIEGNYKDSKPRKNGFASMSNNQYDFDQLEEQLLKAQEV